MTVPILDTPSLLTSAVIGFNRITVSARLCKLQPEIYVVWGISLGDFAEMSVYRDPLIPIKYQDVYSVSNILNYFTYFKFSTDPTKY